MKLLRNVDFQPLFTFVVIKEPSVHTVVGLFYISDKYRKCVNNSDIIFYLVKFLHIIMLLEAEIFGTYLMSNQPLPGDLFEVREIVLLFSSSSIFMLSSVFTNLFCIIYSYQMLLFLVSADARVFTNFHEVFPEQNVL